MWMLHFMCQHKVITQAHCDLEKALATYVENKQKLIVFGDKKKWRDVEADETVFEKEVVECSAEVVS